MLHFNVGKVSHIERLSKLFFILLEPLVGGRIRCARVSQLPILHTGRESRLVSMTACLAGSHEIDLSPGARESTLPRISGDCGYFVAVIS